MVCHTRNPVKGHSPPLYLPQLAELEIPRPMDVAGGALLYDGSMKRVYLADAQTEERSALRLLLLDLNLHVVGEAADWPTVLAQAPAAHPDMGDPVPKGGIENDDNSCIRHCLKQYCCSGDNPET